MKRNAIFALAGAGIAAPLLFAAPSRLAETERYKIDASHTSVIYAVKHLNTSIFRGRFNEIEGTLVVDPKNPEGSSIELSIPTASIDSNNEKRDQHLKSPDFFNAKQFPKITFKSTKVKAGAEGKLEIAGDLTLHGVTKSITVHAIHVGSGKDPWGGTRTGYDTSFRIKRSDFGMKFMLDGIGDEVDIAVGIEAIKE